MQSEVRVLTAVALGMALSTQVMAWTDAGGGDHGGSNWVIAGGSSIASNHYNIGLVSIATGATVTVRAWDGSRYGSVEIQAADIRIDGVLDATGVGYGGGNGGNGGFGSTQVGGAGGAGTPAATAGQGPWGGAAGAQGVGGYDSGNPALTRPGWPGGAGAAGGYLTNGMQGDSTTNETVLIGSGGGGGGGGGAGWNLAGTTSGGGGGGAGNPGGGMVCLTASNAIVIRGTILAKGMAGSRQNGTAGQTQMNPGAGGSLGFANLTGQSLGGNGGASIPGQCYPGGAGGNGAPGAGGGILLHAQNVDTVGGILDNRGGGNSVTNGGTLKVFYGTLLGGSYTNTGRAYLMQLLPPEPGTVFEF